MLQVAESVMSFRVQSNFSKYLHGDKSLLVSPLSYSSSPSHSATVSARANNPTCVINISKHISSVKCYSELRAEDSHPLRQLLIN